MAKAHFLLNLTEIKLAVPSLHLNFSTLTRIWSWSLVFSIEVTIYNLEKTTSQTMFRLWDIAHTKLTKTNFGSSFHLNHPTYEANNDFHTTPNDVKSNCSKQHKGWHLWNFGEHMKSVDVLMIIDTTWYFNWYAMHSKKFAMEF